MAALVRECFGDASAYDILGVDKKATQEQIKRAYYKKALQWVC
jgi:curved DNA-binding protein CbpA